MLPLVCYLWYVTFGMLLLVSYNKYINFIPSNLQRIIQLKMATQVKFNPFSVNLYVGEEYFCDRVSETNLAIKNLSNGNSSTILSIRRIGKTGLIHHILNQLPEGFQGVYVDLLETENMKQFLSILATAIMSQVPEKTKFGKNIWNFLSSLRPTISFDPLNGLPQASFTISNEEANNI